MRHGTDLKTPTSRASSADGGFSACHGLDMLDIGEPFFRSVISTEHSHQVAINDISQAARRLAG